MIDGKGDRLVDYFEILWRVVFFVGIMITFSLVCKHSNAFRIIKKIFTLPFITWKRIDKLNKFMYGTLLVLIFILALYNPITKERHNTVAGIILGIICDIIVLCAMCLTDLFFQYNQKLRIDSRTKTIFPICFLMAVLILCNLYMLETIDHFYGILLWTISVVNVLVLLKEMMHMVGKNIIGSTLLSRISFVWWMILHFEIALSSCVACVVRVTEEPMDIWEVFFDVFYRFTMGIEGFGNTEGFLWDISNLLICVCNISFWFFFVNSILGAEKRDRRGRYYRKR